MTGPSDVAGQDERAQRLAMAEIVRRARAAELRRAAADGRRYGLRFMLARPVRALREARSGVRQYGGAIAARFGVGRARQLADLCLFRVRYGVEPQTYYQFRLFLPERRAQAWAYLTQRHQLDVLYRPLRDGRSNGFQLLHYKDRFAEWCRAHDLPTTPILAKVWPDRVERLTEALPARDLFSKPLGGGLGVGVRMWRHETSPEGIDRWRDDAAPVDADGLVAALRATASRQGQILQPRVLNHAAIADLSSGALNTVRVITLRADGDVQVLLAAYRMAMGGTAADNFDVGGLASPVDVATGRLGQAVRKHPRECIAIADVHPDSGATIAGRVLPDWPALLALAQRAHRGLPDLSIVGWDVALTTDGPMLIEGNSGPGTYLSQMPSGLPLGRTVYVQRLLEIGR